MKSLTGAALKAIWYEAKREKSLASLEVLQRKLSRLKEGIWKLADGMATRMIRDGRARKLARVP